MTAATIKEKSTSRTKAIFVVHIYGLPCDMDPIVKLAKERKITLIEDCAHAPGAEYKGKKAGSMSDYGCFSFHTAKNMTTLGEGGVITTNDDAAADIPALRHVGMVHHERQETYWKPYLYDIVKARDRFPYNFCMTEIRAAVARVQLGRADALNARRRATAARLSEEP